MKGSYRIADHLIEIDTLYDDVHGYCAGYRAEGAPEFTARMTREDLELEREKIRNLKFDEPADAPKRERREAYLEFIAVYRKIAEWMPTQDTFLMHGSAIAVDGAAYLFTAKSGTGKSTHARLWRELLGNRAVTVNDDKPLIHVSETGEAVVYGTPWCGKHRLGNNIRVPLKAICLLERSEENRIRRITRAEAYPMLMQQAYRPEDPEALRKTVALIDRMDVEYYRLGCNMEREAAELSYRTMKQ